MRGAAALGSVEATLCFFEAIADDGLDRVGRTCHHLLTIVVRIEGRENVIGNVARIPAPRPTHSDPQTKELRCTERLSDRT